MDRNYNCKRVAYAISAFGEGSLTRRELSDTLAVSFDVAAELIYRMESAGLIRKVTGKYRTSGRPAVRYAPVRCPVAAVTMITGDLIRTRLYGAAASSGAPVITQITDPTFPDDFVISHLTALSQTVSDLRAVCVAADGIPIDGTFTGCALPALNGYPVSDVFREFFPSAKISLENRYILAYRSARLRFPDAALQEGGAVYFLRDECGFAGSAVIVDGKVVSGRRGLAGHMERIRTASGRMASAALKYARDIWSYASAVAEILSPAARLLDPAGVIINTDRYSTSSGLEGLIEEKLICEQGFDPADIPPIVVIKSGDDAPFDAAFEMLKEHLYTI